MKIKRTNISSRKILDHIGYSFVDLFYFFINCLMHLLFITFYWPSWYIKFSSWWSISWLSMSFKASSNHSFFRLSIIFHNNNNRWYLKSKVFIRSSQNNIIRFTLKNISHCMIYRMSWILVVWCLLCLLDFFLIVSFIKWPLDKWWIDY